MIHISNGLLPDIENISPQPEELVSFSYDNTLDEIDGAMETFQKTFARRKGLLPMIAYGFFTFAIVVAIVINPTSIFAYAALLFCGFGFFYSITDSKRTRQKTIEALKDMNPEEYKATFYSDKIKVETIIKQKENEVNLKIDEEADDEIISPLESVFVFGSDVLDFAENDESLLLVYNRRQIYCFPKRCLTSEQENAVRKLLSEKLSMF